MSETKLQEKKQQKTSMCLIFLFIWVGFNQQHKNNENIETISDVMQQYSYFCLVFLCDINLTVEVKNALLQRPNIKIPFFQTAFWIIIFRCIH